MDVVHLELPEVILATPRRFGDPRGHFAETYNARRFADAGIDCVFIQDNQSLSRDAGTLRGLHCQIGPNAQGKLVRVLRGSIWDVAIDIRAGSPRFGQWAAATLTAERGEQLFVPPGFLHGFCTLEPNTEVFYKVSGAYDPASERGVIWNDPNLALPWPLNGAEPALSDKDSKLPGFAACAGWFPE
jgi:dTDP-4-dehydrorhamnose 3,5-epimerase